MSRSIVASIEAEFRRYKALGEAAIEQLESNQVSDSSASNNSVATLVWHVSGNLASRFTDFLGSDGEKPWRDRDSEFEARRVGKCEVLEKWDEGWATLSESLEALTDDDLNATVTIRGIPLTVHEALHRSLAHTSYHVGQIVLICRSLKAADWSFLSIPPGGSAAYNRKPAYESAEDHAARVRDRSG